MMSVKKRVVVVALLWLTVLFGCAGGNIEENQAAPTLPDDVYEEIIAHYRNHRYDLVKQYIARSQESGVRDKRLYFLSGILAWEAGNYEQAKTAFKQAIDLDPEYSDAYNNLGILYMRDKEYTEAESAFHKALENPLYLTPEKALVNLGKLMEAEKNDKAAEQYYRHAIKLKPGFFQAYYNLGMLFYRLENFRLAAAVFDQAVKLAPRWPPVWFWYGMSLKETNEYGKARAAFGKVQALKPDSEMAKRAAMQLKKLPDN